MSHWNPVPNSYEAPKLSRGCNTGACSPSIRDRAKRFEPCFQCANFRRKGPTTPKKLSSMFFTSFGEPNPTSEPEFARSTASSRARSDTGNARHMSELLRSKTAIKQKSIPRSPRINNERVPQEATKGAKITELERDVAHTSMPQPAPTAPTKEVARESRHENHTTGTDAQKGLSNPTEGPKHANQRKGSLRSSQETKISHRKSNVRFGERTIPAETRSIVANELRMDSNAMTAPPACDQSHLSGHKWRSQKLQLRKRAPRSAPGTRRNPRDVAAKIKAAQRARDRARKISANTPDQEQQVLSNTLMPPRPHVARKRSISCESATISSMARVPSRPPLMSHQRSKSSKDLTRVAGRQETVENHLLPATVVNVAKAYESNQMSPRKSPRTKGTKKMPRIPIQELSDTGSLSATTSSVLRSSVLTQSVSTTDNHTPMLRTPRQKKRTPVEGTQNRRGRSPNDARRSPDPAPTASRYPHNDVERRRRMEAARTLSPGNKLHTTCTKEKRTHILNRSFSTFTGLATPPIGVGGASISRRNLPARGGTRVSGRHARHRSESPLASSNCASRSHNVAPNSSERIKRQTKALTLSPAIDSKHSISGSRHSRSSSHSPSWSTASDPTNLRHARYDLVEDGKGVQRSRTPFAGAKNSNSARRRVTHRRTKTDVGECILSLKGHTIDKQGGRQSAVPDKAPLVSVLFLLCVYECGRLLA